MIQIALGADHRGYEHKEIIKATFDEQGYALIDVGTDSQERTDYPMYTKKVVKLIKDGQAQLGILLCGTGIGMAIAANRHAGIYAGIAWNELVARKAKEDDKVNLLVLPSDFITDMQLLPIIHAWLHATFKGGRYQERIDMIDAIKE